MTLLPRMPGQTSWRWAPPRSRWQRRTRYHRCHTPTLLARPRRKSRANTGATRRSSFEIVSSWLLKPRARPAQSVPCLQRCALWLGGGREGAAWSSPCQPEAHENRARAQDEQCSGSFCTDAWKSVGDQSEELRLVAELVVAQRWWHGHRRHAQWCPLDAATRFHQASHRRAHFEPAAR